MKSLMEPCGSLHGIILFTHSADLAFGPR